MELEEGWGCNECLFSKKNPKFDWFRLYLGFKDGRGRKRKKRVGEKKKEGEKGEEKRKRGGLHERRRAQWCACGAV